MVHLADSTLFLIPGGALITDTPEEGRAVAMLIARHTIHNIQPDLHVLKRMVTKLMLRHPHSLTTASQVVAIKFQTIVEANN